MMNVIDNNNNNNNNNINDDIDKNNKNDIIRMIKTLTLSLDEKKMNMKNIWSNVIDIILIFQSDNSNNNNNNDIKVEFISELEKIIFIMLKYENLYQIWYDILDENINNQMKKKRAQQLLNGYKIIINFLGISSIDTFCNGILLDNKWNIININTMLSIININSNSNIINSFCNLVAYDTMPKNCMISILRYLIIDSNNTTDFIISNFSDDWCFQSIELILRDINAISNNNNNTTTNNNTNNKQELLILTNFEIFIKKLILKILEGYEPKVLIDVIFLKKSYNNIIIKSIINVFPDQHIPILIYSIASLWGNKLFLSRGDIKMINYLTEALLLVLDRIEKSLLPRNENDVTPIIPMSSYICNGISSYFESNDKNLRIKGMLVATKYSTIMGDPIVFDELKAVNNNNEIVSNASQNEIVNDIDENNSNNTNSEDFDDESDLESYDLEEELDNQNIVQTSYLKTCLESLQLSTEAYDKHKSALISIPNIVASNPVDLHDISGPLILELLRLTNMFNIEDFEDIRNKAILAIVNKSPIITIPIITSTFTTDNYSIGDQLLAISIVIQSAYSIADVSGLPSQQSTFLSEDNNNNNNNKEKEKEKEYDITTSSSKTTIKRATKLAQSKKQIVYFSNKFFGISNLYYEPLIQLLSNFYMKINEKTDSIIIEEESDKKTSIAMIKDLIIDTNKKNNDDVNSFDYLIPSKAMSALGQLIKCLRNTTIQKSFAYKVIHISIQFVSSSSLEMRQSSLFSIYEAIKLLSSESILSSSKSLPTTPLGLLQNISSYDNHSNNNNNDLLNDPFIINMIDWCMKTANNDADVISRTLKYEIVKIAINDNN